MKILPINLDDLIHARSVESVRREFKKAWSEQTLEQTLRSICAFANDFFNLNGGYIIIGIEEQEGRPVLPPLGLESFNLDEIQKQLRGNCKRLDPEYQPVISPEVYQDKQILVVWVPGGEFRPYSSPKTLDSKERAFYVRLGSETVEARSDILTQLMQMTARVPFDDRKNRTVGVDIISPALVRNYLADTKSDLTASGANISDIELYRNLGIAAPLNDHDVPKNIALLFFVHDPEKFFPGARIEVVQFGDDAGGNAMEERVFRGPLHLQIRQALDYLNGLSATLIKKIPDKAEAERTVAFPFGAMEEAIVNAIFHRSYEGVYEPTKVYLYPDRMEIISYPGPMPGLELHHFQPGMSIPPVPYRNRLIGEFLTRLKLAEGLRTGVPKIRRKMNENGSPLPIFDFDAARTYFRVILPAHSQYVVINALREGAHFWAIGERERATQILEGAVSRVPKSGALLAQLIDYRTALGEVEAAEKIFSRVETDVEINDRHLPFIALARTRLDSRNHKRYSAMITNPQDRHLVELAILHRRAGFLNAAHRVLAAHHDLLKNDPKALHEYARTKIQLARSLDTKYELATKRQLNLEAAELLRRALQLSDDKVRNAWCWFDLAKTLAWLRSPETEVVQAYSKAVELLPNEPRFANWYEKWNSRRSVPK